MKYLKIQEPIKALRHDCHESYKESLTTFSLLITEK